MSAKPVVLVLGAGKKTGDAVAAKFSSAGYAVALVARSIEDGKTADGHLTIKADLSDPAVVPSIFAKVKQAIGTPSTVVYNAATASPPPDTSNIFSTSIETLNKDLNILTHSAFVAAREAVAGFDTLPKETKKTFILTGNLANKKILPIPAIFTLGIGKSAAAYWIGTAAGQFQDRQYRFYYADQRKPDGSLMMGGVDGPGHAEEYYKLATQEEVQPWDYSFVPGKGYVDFSKA